VGALQLVCPEALLTGFELLCQGTLAEGCALKQNEVPPAAVCRACGERFSASLENFRCPSCGRADAEIREGRDIMLKTITGETEDETGGGP